ncbi:histidine triad nucleotide-binding protein [Ructibacterium gallinarum]|uniref:Histidine triad nucleotide-binding protein n=1 Tax=Ructibacterium gallinarum TaxID=2779355 RepID=A0A9D5M3J2_9FIRM|nr:histidine triad nucleotide-binding protein [Ructibacterium gallinarum]MBE5040034.1 histidine triad nucleotide-binding protein [Ructibacterium gallinarum]
MEDCLFCKIIRGEIPSTKVYEDDQVYAFLDIEPQAPTHIILVPKEHIASANELTKENAAVVGHIFTVAASLAAREGFAEKGYRIVNNCGEDGGQTVGHLHFHLLAGRNLGWPPG